MKRLLLSLALTHLFVIAFSQSDNRNETLRQEVTQQEKILQKKPHNEKALSKVAISYFKLNEFQTAISYYDRLIAINSKVSGAYANRGMCRLLTGNKQGACSDFKVSIIKGEDPKLIENRKLSEYIADECGK